jgi:hypothetical protein
MMLGPHAAWRCIWLKRKRMCMAAALKRERHDLFGVRRCRREPHEMKFEAAE